MSACERGDDDDLRAGLNEDLCDRGALFRVGLCIAPPFVGISSVSSTALVWITRVSSTALVRITRVPSTALLSVLVASLVPLWFGLPGSLVPP
jgi:hypothetical protein